MNTILAWSAPGGPELLIILLIVLLLFGAKKLPELARGLGGSVKEFRKAKDEFDDELKKAGEDLSIDESKTEGPRPRQTSTTKSG